MTLFRSMGAAQDAAGGTEPVEVRKGLGGIFTGPGVLPGAVSPLITGTGTMAYACARANFVTSRGASDGVNLFGNDGTQTGIGTTGVGSTVPAAPGVGLSRIDIIWVRHPTNGENGDTTSEPVFGVSSGTASSTPTAPTIPTGALELGRNLMTSSASSTSSAGNTITQTAEKAYLLGAGFRRVMRHRTTAGSIGDSTWTALGNWNGTTDATGAPSTDFSLGSTTLTTNYTGWVRLRAFVSFDFSSAGSRLVRLLQEGGVVAANGFGSSASGNSVARASVEWEGPCTSGDEFTVEAYQSSGGTLALKTTGNGTGWFCERVE